MTVASFVVKVIGSLNWIFVSRILGGEGIGLYQMAFPIYFFAMSISQAGVPVAISIITAERVALKDVFGARRVFRISMTLMVFTGLLFSLLTYFGAGWLIEWQFIRDPRAYMSVVALSPTIFFVTLLASSRGYLQGWQRMTPTAVSQIVEQIFRVLTMVLFASLLLPMGLDYAAAGASLGAFAGAGGATFLVLWLTHYYGRGKSFMILIAGMGIHAVCSAAVSLVISLAPSSRTVANISYWLLGSLEKASWEKDLYLAAIALPILLFFLLQTRILNLMLLGDETARTLGYRLEKRRLLFILLCAAATAMVVYNVGIIGFVGLAVPHIARLLVGGSYTKLLPVCAALGAGALAWADVFSRLAVENGELPIGIVVSLLGSPVFLHLLLKRKRS